MPRLFASHQGRGRAFLFASLCRRRFQLNYRRLSDYPTPHPASTSDDLGGESVSGRTGASGHFVALSRALGFRHRKRRLPDLGASKPDPESDGKMNLESAHTGTRTRIIRTHAVADPQRHGVSAAFTAGPGFQAGAFSESSAIDGICADSRGGHLRQVARSPRLLREVSRGTPRRRLPR